ncbi:uncharacterized protein LOC106175393 [Lingula anatina]|uniref:Uncharacterized protein LOC106175393 n=1 Tax=Lingula anatina TaxID=7574 RepID=A0A1S3JQZ9_LINAN|nr:uncharacterized protein LOC106175393 [Lingula anatina]|eukprot:XP_013412823.1 uncharacterized protein LOC106175393 [Lingula anatina]
MPASKEAESMKADIQTAAIASTMGVLVVIGIIIAVFLIRRRLVQNSEDKHSGAKFTNSQHPSGAAFEQSIYSNEICLEQMHATESGNKATAELPTPSKNQDRSPSQNIDDSYTKVYKPARQDQDSISDRYDALYELENPTIKTGENEYFSIIESDTNTAQQKQTAPDPSNVVMVENDIYDRGVEDDYTSSTTLVENDLYNA